MAVVQTYTEYIKLIRHNLKVKHTCMHMCSCTCTYARAYTHTHTQTMTVTVNT